MSFEFVIDLHNLHVLGYAYLGAERAGTEFHRRPDGNDPFHFLHTASLLALAPAIRFMANRTVGSELSPCSDLAVQVSLELGSNAFLPVAASVNECQELAKRASAHLEDDLAGYCAIESIQRVSNRTPTRQGQAADEVTRISRKLLAEYCSPDERSEFLEAHRESPNNGMLLMLTQSSTLHDSLHKIFWPSMGANVDKETVIDRLETLFRMYLYMSVPADAGKRAWYSPQFDRLNRWQQDAKSWMEINDHSQPAGMTDHDLPLLIASVSYLLLRRSDGCPRSILKLACGFREAHAAKIDEHLARCLTAYEVHEDDEVRVLADKLRRDIELEFRGDKVPLLERLEGFLAANGKSLAGHAGASAGVRRVVVKSDVHGETVRHGLRHMDEFIRLSRRIEDGFCSTNVFYRGGVSMFEAAKMRIDSDDNSKALVQAIKHGAVMMCAGSGVTLSSIDPKIRGDYTWEGLIRSGLRRVKQISDRQAIAVAAESLLGSSLGSLPFRFAGDVIRECLNDSAWSAWLHQLFSALAIEDTSLLEAIIALRKERRMRIATTNYDLLIEGASSGLMSCVPDDAGERKVETFFRESHPPYVFHIHGTYDQPDSVVLGNVSYGLLNASRLFRCVEKIFDSQIMFVGFSGFDDPTFARLRQYHREFRFKAQHFVLVRESERARFGEASSDHLVPVVYGTNHDELPSFLHALRLLA